MPMSGRQWLILETYNSFDHLVDWNETLKQVKRVTRMGVTINTFMLDDAPELVGFVEHMTKINKGRAFYTSPHQLGSFLMVDYLSQRRLRRR